MSDYTQNIDDVLSEEQLRIEEWRRACRRPLVATPDEIRRPGPERRPLSTSGLAISGGGIRSAAFSLGATQALEAVLSRDNVTGLRYFDYISTVSGGGYLGSSIIAGMNADEGRFPFSSDARDKVDNLAVGHIRNYSRYLMPNGVPDLIGSAAVVMRGLTANLAMVLGIVLILAGFTGLMNPNQAAYGKADFLGMEGWPNEPFVQAFADFAYTKIFFILAMLHMLCWALVRSWNLSRIGEFAGFWYQIACFWLCLVTLAAFLELQPFAIMQLFSSSDSGSDRSTAVGVVSAIAPYLAILAATGAFAGRLLGNAVKAARLDRSITTLTQAALAKLAALALMLALPLLIWVLYLNLTLWTDIGYVHRPSWLAHIVWSACGAIDPKLALQQSTNGPQCESTYLVGSVFVVVGILLAILTWTFGPNVNSLHRLYRDRLSKAFLFVPDKTPMDAAAFLAKDPKPLGDLTLGELNPAHGPVHLINCALNVQGSKVVNRRGRNADFFFFSSAWSGSNSTGFVRTTSSQKKVALPDLATAMAVSGAAASSNMGGNTIRGLAPTLAVLNIRLGYWMSNPAKLRTGFGSDRNYFQRAKAALRLYFAEEMLGFLDECSDQIYLTDGGHIENLGLYELLRRKCRLILVIDAEADAQMSFASLIACQRFARSDLGVRIELPWSTIGVAAKNSRRGASAMDDEIRRHVAVGGIEYNDGSQGILIYVKASLTGDESDYVKYYKAKNETFPHETTGDQFFSEEQFEAYRALGFHSLHGALAGKCPVAGMDLIAPISGQPNLQVDLRGIIERPTLFEVKAAVPVPPMPMPKPS